MSTITTKTTPPVPTKSTRPPGEQFLLRGMSWEFYVHLLEELGNRQIQVTYDRGELELMSPFYRHESYSRLLGRMVEILAEELGMPFIMAGSTTFRRQSLQRGLEPDECFYIAHASDILGKENLDLEVDPPPDLAIEVDITHRSINRIPIYESLGIPELWRFDGGQLVVYLRQPSGVYAEPQTESLIFPTIPLSGLIEFLNRFTETDHGTLLREFRTWVKQLPTQENKGS
jgi:Uma2 family endonuclease